VLSERERALLLADAHQLAELLRAEPSDATRPVQGLAPLTMLLRRSTGRPANVRRCAELLLDAGADPGAHTVE